MFLSVTCTVTRVTIPHPLRLRALGLLQASADAPTPRQPLSSCVMRWISATICFRRVHHLVIWLFVSFSPDLTSPLPGDASLSWTRRIPGRSSLWVPLRSNFERLIQSKSTIPWSNSVYRTSVWLFTFSFLISVPVFLRVWVFSDLFLSPVSLCLPCPPWSLSLGLPWLILYLPIDHFYGAFSRIISTRFYFKSV